MSLLMQSMNNDGNSQSSTNFNENSTISSNNTINQLSPNITNTINDTTFNIHSQFPYEQNMLHHASMYPYTMPYNPMQYIIAMQKEQQIIINRLIKSEQRLCELEIIVREYERNEKPSEYLDLTFNDFLKEKMSIVTGTLVTMIQSDNYFHHIVGILHKFNDNYIANKDDETEIEKLSTSLFLKLDKDNRNNISMKDYVNIKNKFVTMLRKTWMTIEIFDDKDPQKLRNQYKHYNHKDCVTAISEVIHRIFFNKKNVIIQYKLLSIPGNLTLYYINTT